MSSSTGEQLAGGTLTRDVVTEPPATRAAKRPIPRGKLALLGLGALARPRRRLVWPGVVDGRPLHRNHG